METFWATLKREIAWIRGSLYFATRAELRSVVMDEDEHVEPAQEHRVDMEEVTGKKTPCLY